MRLYNKNEENLILTKRNYNMAMVMAQLRRF